MGAGHPSPLLLKPGSVRIPKDENSLPLGINPDEHYEVTRVEPDDEFAAILFYTDGMVEATGDDSRILGIEPITAALSALDEFDPGTVIRTAREVVAGHLGEIVNMDDMTLLAVRVD